MSAPHYDAVIVGARVAGATTAMLLARQGLRVLVLDRARYGSDTVSTHAFMRGGVYLLHQWGLLDDIVAAGTPPVTKVVFHYPDDTVRISLKPAAGVSALYGPRRTVLDRVIADAAMAAGADVRYGMTVTGLLRDDSGRVTGVRARGRDGRDLTATAPLTVGADGIRSIVAGSVNAPVTRSATGTGSAFIYGHWDELPLEGYEWHYGQNVSAGMIPTNDGQTCLFLGATPARMEALRAAGTRGALEALLGDLSPQTRERVAAARAPAHLRGFAGVPGYLRRPWGPGWALVGDAGCFEDPLSTHGMTDALRDAALLAEAVAQIRGGTATETAAFGSFQARRDALTEPLFAAMEDIASYRWTLPGLRRLLLEASSAMTGQVEALQDLVADRGLAPATTS